jgi:tripartite motif-containing protein 71
MLSRYSRLLVTSILVLASAACSGLDSGASQPAQVQAPPAAANNQPESQAQPTQLAQAPTAVIPPTAPPQPTAELQRGPEAEKAPTFVHLYGEGGIEPGQLSSPSAVAIDDAGNLYVGDNKGLFKFDSSGEFLLAFGPEGYAGFTSAVAIGPDGVVYRSDPQSNVIVMYDPSSGEQIGTLGEPGSEDGQFNEPFGMTFDSDGNLYVVDRRNWRVQKFDATGEFVMSFGSRGDKNGEFINPRDVTVDAEGNIYVTDQVTYLVQKFSPEGEFLTRFGQSHAGETLWLVRGITIDDSGHIYITDGLHNRVQVFDAAGTYLLEFGLPGQRPGYLNDPDDIIYHDGKLYVAEKGNNRIQEFAVQW